MTARSLALAAALALGPGLGAPAARAQDEPGRVPPARTVRIHLADGARIVGTVIEDDASASVLRVRTAWADDVAIPRASVLAIEDASEPAAERPTSVVRFEIDASGGAAKTEPRLLRAREGAARAEFRFLVTGRVDAVTRADGTPLPHKTEPRPNATLVTVKLPKPIESGGSEWIGVVSYDAGAVSRGSAAEAVFRYRRGAPVDEAAVIQVVLPPGAKLLGAAPPATEVPQGTLVFRKDLAQGETLDVEARFTTAGR